MNASDAFPPEHQHDFLGAGHRRNEHRVWAVVAVTAAAMVAEIAAGTAYGSMALVADGWHMSTHAGAMLIAALAYMYSRRHAGDRRFSFGTGKLGDLAGFASAVALALVALLIGWESLWRLASPVPIGFAQAIAVAVAGLAVNLACAWLLRDEHGDGHDHHAHAHAYGHGHAHSQGDGQNDGQDHGHDHGHAARDNNLRAAYLHVLADALTSVLAIAALLLGRFYGWLWADPAMGVVGALVIVRWSWGLMRDAGRVLLDAAPQAEGLRGAIRQVLERDGARIADLHVWQVGPGHHAAIVSLAAAQPAAPSHYKALLAQVGGLAHVTVEVEAGAS